MRHDILMEHFVKRYSLAKFLHSNVNLVAAADAVCQKVQSNKNKSDKKGSNCKSTFCAESTIFYTGVRSHSSNLP